MEWGQKKRHVRAVEPRELDRRDPDAGGAGVNEHVVALLHLGKYNEGLEGGEEHLGDARSLDPGEVGGFPEQVPVRRDDVLRIRAL